MTSVERFEDKYEFAFAGAQRVQQAGRQAIRERGRFDLVLAGGLTPRPVYDALAHPEFPLDWSRTWIWFGDERAVGPEHAWSNYAMADRTLISKISIPAEQVLPMQGERGAPEAARHYQKLLEERFGDQPPIFDMILLGMGPDGHTASLMPDSPLLDQTGPDASGKATPWVAATPAVGEPVVERITLTLPVLNAARAVLFLISGEAKLAIAEQIVAGAPEARQYPASRVQPAGALEWFWMP